MIHQHLDRGISTAPLVIGSVIGKKQVIANDFIKLEDFITLVKKDQSLDLCNLRFFNLNHENQHEIKPLFLEFKNHETLKVLKLDFSLARWLTNIHMQYLSNGIRQLQLITFSLKFNHSYAMTDDGVKSISKAISKIKTLNKMDFSFNFCEKISAKSVYHVCKAVESQRFLKVLSLQFCFKETEENQAKYIDYLRRCSTNLKTFIFECNSIGDNEVTQLKLMKMWRNLRVLKIFFTHGCKLTDEGIRTLCEVINVLPSLSELYLEFEYCNISQKGLDDLKITINGIKSLEHIKITFWLFSLDKINSENFENEILTPSKEIIFDTLFE